MYDLKSGTDAGREWIEIENEGDMPISLSGFRFLDSSKDVLENHEPIKAIHGGSTLPPHGYAVIASDAKKFLIDNPGFSGILFSSSFSLSNTGEILVLKDKVGNEIDRILYMSSWGGAGDGNSIQRYTDGWHAGVPSPGAPERIPSPSPIKPKISAIVEKSVTTPGPSSRPDFKEKNIASVQDSGVSQSSNSFEWILGFVAFLALIIVGFLFVSKGKNPIDEIKIIE